jgi:hypothetical protein
MRNERLDVFVSYRQTTLKESFLRGTFDGRAKIMHAVGDDGYDLREIKRHSLRECLGHTGENLKRFFFDVPFDIGGELKIFEKQENGVF